MVWYGDQNVRDIIGTPPIHPVWFAIAKASLAAPWVVLVAALTGHDFVGHRIPALAWPAGVAAALGLLLAILALSRLGDATRLGLPVGSTVLKTTGPYAFSRNPVYVGAALMCLASCLYVPHWFTVGCTVLAAALHHRIVLAEERFLAQRFGAAWDEYRSRVRRYL